MYESLGICLSLVGLLAIHSVGALLAALIWRGSARAAGSWSSSSRAQFLFLLRVAPGLAAIVCVGAVFIPAYLANEPRHTSEIVTVKLGLLAAASLYGIGVALWRGLATGLVTRRLVRDWLKHAEPVEIENVKIPAFRFRHQFPVIGIVGAFRPRLFIADQIFHALSAEEVSAAVAHENGHLFAGDNLKRGLLRVCRNLLSIIPLARPLEGAWDKEAESAADDYAARGGACAALNLASALVKIARLVPRGCKPATPASVSLVVEDPGGIAARVLRLTRIAAEPDDPRPAGTQVLNLTMGACLSAFLAAVILTVSSSGLLSTIHSALEHVVAALQ